MSFAQTDTDYDFIISGAGAAGLSLLAKMISSGKFTASKILLVDKAPKTNNDRTWCFWEKGTGFFESIVYKSWPSLWFHGKGFSRLLDIAPYCYKMIRGTDFYNFCFSLIATQKNITVRYGNVQAITSDEKETSILFDDRKITASHIFNSILFTKPLLTPKEFYLLQHFKGYIIETSQPIFDEAEATLMDFRVSQQQGTAFVYVMPFTGNTALVEFTMFSKNLLEQQEYDDKLDHYIRTQLNCNDYQVKEAEFGTIPMTNYKFQSNNRNVTNIGTAGGQTKASTGYTFTFIQKRVEEIVESLLNGNNSFQKSNSVKYSFYDSVLLNVLSTGKLPGDAVFTRLFAKNAPQLIFGFLDNNSTIFQDIQLISSLPTIPFLKAGFQEFF